MYAVIEVGGRQWKVAPGVQLEVNRIAAEVGAQHTVERVLLAADGDQIRVGRPYVEGGRVVCEVVAHGAGPKVRSYHYRRRENWRRTVGHRQPVTRLLVKDIQLPGATAAAASAAPAAVKPAGRKAVARATVNRPRTKAKE
jgi:large subunit ribosomal protein L21